MAPACEPAGALNRAPITVSMQKIKTASHSNGTEEAARQRYSNLLRILRAANDKLDPKNVISSIMHGIKKIIPCEGWSILLIDSNRNELIFEGARGAAASKLAYAKLKIGEGIAGWVAQHGKPAIVNDVRRDSRFNSSFDKASNFTT